MEEINVKRSIGGDHKCRSTFLLLFVLLIASPAVKAQSLSPQPAIFFTDITSGPNSGGESVSGFSGAYVTIYGNNFGSSQGTSTVTLNGAICLRVVSWGTTWLWYQKIVVQLGSTCASGDFSVTVNGLASGKENVTLAGSAIDYAAFTVTSGTKIDCVSNAGNNSNSGLLSTGACWHDMQQAIQSMGNGDITYVENGVNDTGAGLSCAQYNSILCTTSAGAPGAPKALVAYPGASVRVTSSTNYSIRILGTSYWVFAGIAMTTNGVGETVNVQYTNFQIRLIALVLSCPSCTGTAATMELEGNPGGSQPDMLVYGNQWTSSSSPGSASKTFHALYASNADDHSDVAWNDIHNVYGGRAIQFYASSGVDMTDIHVHDNLIYNSQLDGINLAAIRTDTGSVEIFNNVEYNVGRGPDPPDGAGVSSCINLQSYGTYTQSVQIYNNTCYNAGYASSNPTQSGGLSLYVPAVLRNNLIYQANGQPYLTSDGACKDVSSGSTNNNWYGNGAAPSCSGLALNTNVDPMVVNVSSLDFHLQSTSPMIGAGTTSKYSTFDRNGLVRPSPPSIGAYEFSSGTIQKPNPPTNLTVTAQ